MARSIKRWRTLTWEALSRWKRSSCVCQRCGKHKEPRLLDAHHLIPKARGNYAMFEPENIVSLCDYCHRRWWHGSSTWEEQRDLIDSWIGLERYQEIKRQAQISCKYKEADYERMLEEFTVND